MMRFRRAALLVGWVIVVSILMSFAGTGFAADQPRYGGTLVMAIPNDPPSLNPALSTDATTHLVVSKIFDGLVQVKPGWDPVPNLASSWDISGDGLTYTFYLVEGVRWHDGTPFTSADVKFSFEQALGQYHPTASGLMKDVIDRIETPDEHTVIFRLKEVYPPFLAMMITNTAGIIPKHIYDGSDIPNHPANFDNPIGTGPFKLAEWRRGDRIVLERNPDYFREDLPYLDRIILKILPDPSARVMAFERGEVDLLDHYVIPFQDVERLINRPDVKYNWRNSSGIQILFFNLRKSPMDNKDFRWAIAHAIDREFIVDQGMFGIANIADGPFSRETPWAKHPNPPRYDFDLDQANELFDLAGYPRGQDGLRLKLRLAYDSSFLPSVNTAPVIKEQLRQVGIDVELLPLERSVMIKQVFQEWDFDLFMHMYAGFQDPSLGVQRAYVSDNIRREGFTNVSGYNNPEVDQLFRLASQTVDLEKRGQAYKQATEIIINDMPMVWLFERVEVCIANKEFQGLWQGHVTGEQMFERIWWIGGDVSR